MHYADSFSCREKMKDRPEPIEKCGSRLARQKIRNDETLVDHDRIAWDCLHEVLRIPPNVPDDLVDAISGVYMSGFAAGIEKGREDVRREFRELLDLGRRES